jgi:hypothetical protein
MTSGNVTAVRRSMAVKGIVIPYVSPVMSWIEWNSCAVASIGPWNDNLLGTEEAKPRAKGRCDACTTKPGKRERRSIQKTVGRNDRQENL